MYYLQSRYYNPTWGRFISADNYPTTGQGLTGNNMFAYCGNNPVSRADDSGEFWHLVIGGIIGGVIGAVSAAVSGGDVVDVLIGAAAGAGGGVLAASGAGVVVQALGSAAISMTSNALGQAKKMASGQQDEFNFGDMFFDGVVGLACGIAGGNGASYGNTKGINAATKQWFKKGFFDSNARKYYIKNACRAGGDHVFDALLDSMNKTVIGAAITTGKNVLISWGVL